MVVLTTSAEQRATVAVHSTRRSVDVLSVAGALMAHFSVVRRTALAFSAVEVVVTAMLRDAWVRQHPRIFEARGAARSGEPETASRGVPLCLDSMFAGATTAVKASGDVETAVAVSRSPSSSTHSGGREQPRRGETHEDGDVKSDDVCPSRVTAAGYAGTANGGGGHAACVPGTRLCGAGVTT